jgi:outer membrane receptor for ferrienterochelin and colicin
MNVEVTVASQKPLTLRESPGIVTLITEDEIKNSGSMDLMDLLKTVPGFEFGVDVEGVTSLGVRGNWGHEGKILMLLDGIEMNEEMYSTLQFGNHYPIDQIKRIEIIRGPGSAIYGGNAEYAVINIITANNKEFTGLSAVASYSQMKNSYSKRNISLTAGKHFGDFALNIGTLIGEGNRTDGKYTDYLGNTASLEDRQALNPSFLELAASYKELSIRAMIDNYHTTTMDGYNVLLQQPYGMDFNTSVIEARYKWNINKKLSLTPRLSLKRQSPWKYNGDSNDMEFPPYDRTASQPLANITGNYDANAHWNIKAGMEYSVDKATDNVEGSFFKSGDKTVSYGNTSAFAQAFWTNPIVNITVGARYHNNSFYKASFVPRIGITKVINKFHTKLLFSSAYRAPGIENIDRGDKISPERTTVMEFESGYQFTDLLYFSANVYDITTDNIIVYNYDNGDSYSNAGTSGTRGIEMEMKIKGWLGFIDLNYSYYTTEGKEKVKYYTVEEDQNVLLAFPAHKINLSGSLRLSRHLSVFGSLSWKSKSYSVISTDTLTQKNISEEIAPRLYENIYLNFSDVLVQGFSIGAGCQNISATKDSYIQPYDSYHSPLPGPGREIYMKISYTIK